MSNTQTLLTTSRFRVEKVAHTSADGNTYERAIIRHTGAVTIIPVVDQQRICLIRNYRVAVAQSLIELPAGTLEPGEAPLAAAHRELLEETGFQAAKMRHLSSFFLSPGILDERMHLFLAEELTEVKPQREPGEEIENLFVTWEQALRWLRDGTIHDAKTMIGLFWGSAHRQ